MGISSFDALEDKAHLIFKVAQRSCWYILLKDLHLIDFPSADQRETVTK